MLGASSHGLRPMAIDKKLPTTIGLLGYGEAGQAIAASLRAQNPDYVIFAYDIASHNTMPFTHVQKAEIPQDLALNSDIILSLVTADEAVAAAQMMAPYLQEHHIFLDGNSVSPGTKRQAASSLASFGPRYCDMAIMAPIHPRGHKTPLLISGAHEAIVAPILTDLAFSFTWEGGEIGDASVVKMLRSILIKGMECLISESVTASQSLGLDERILRSAGQTLGIADMPALADYVMERAATHGRRRAAEMREVVKTLQELGLSNDMSKAIAHYQDRIADMRLSEVFEGNIPRDRHQLAPQMRAAQTSPKP